MYIIVGCFFVFFGLKALLFDGNVLLGSIFLILGPLVFKLKPKQSSKSDAFAELGGDSDGGGD